MEFVEAVPLDRRTSSLFLIPIPLERSADLARLAGRPFIAFGPADGIAFAFSAGCLDYLRDPWTNEEFLLRVGRYFAGRSLYLAGSDLMLSQGFLKGPRGMAKISPREEILLRIIHRYAGRPVSRSFLASNCGYADPSQSRSFDVALSRIRSLLAALCDTRNCVNVRSIRGKGLVFSVSSSEEWQPVDKL